MTFHDMDEMPQVSSRYLGDRKHVVIPECVGPVRYVGQDDVRTDIANLEVAMRQHGVDVDSAFLPAASPGILAVRMTNHHYGSYEEYVMALADEMRTEYRIIGDSGLLLQLDCPDIPFSHPGHGRFWASDVVARMGHREFVRLHARAIAHATADVPGERLRLHLCWGNYEGPHHRDVPLRDVLEPVLEETHAKAISFEAANPRHGHEWSMLGEIDLPEDVVLMPGVIDTTTNFVEHPELVAERIVRLAKLVGRDSVIASTDCGFAQGPFARRVHPSIQWAKLRALSEGARIADKQLKPKTGKKRRKA
jgi:5-methyltetrahydropteroyltriglutamate--homocysteine methyltransferase